MADKLELLIEADKRGLLTPEKSAMVQELVKRAAPKVADPEQGDDRAKLLSNPLMRLAKGMKDTIDGPAQFLANSPVGKALEAPLDRATEAVYSIPGIGPVIKSSNLLAKPSDVNRDIRQSNAEYEQARTATAPATLETLVTGKRDPGIDWMRLGGNVVGPGNKLLPTMGPAATAGRVVGQGAVTGGAAALLQPVTGEGDYWTQKGIQVGTGMVGGAVLAPIFSKVIQTAADKIGPLVDRLKVNLSDKAIQRETDNVIAQAFEKQGVDIASIPAATMEKIKAEVQSALKTGAKITDPSQIARKAEFEALGMAPTAAQISRDPMAFANEKNLRGVVGAGEDLTARFNEQNGQLIRALNNRGAAGAKGELATAESLKGVLNAGDQARKSATTALYDKARDNVGRAAELDHRAFADNAIKALDESMLGYALPNQARQILNDISTGKIPLNVTTAEQIKTVLGSLGSGASVTGAEKMALKTVRDALDNTPVAHALGEDAVKAFAQARASHQARMGLQEKIPALAAAAEDIAPDKFFQKFILNGNRRDLMELSGLLKKESPEAVEQIKAQIVDHLKEKALNKATDEVGVFSQSAYNKALDSLADKLPAFFTKQEITELGRVGRVASYIQAVPAAAAVNTSNTAGAALNLLNKVGKIPGVGPYVSTYAAKPLQSAAEQKAAQEALAAKLATQAPEQSAAKIRDLLERGRRPLAIGTGLGAGALVGRD